MLGPTIRYMSRMFIIAGAEEHLRGPIDVVEEGEP